MNSGDPLTPCTAACCLESGLAPDEASATLQTFISHPPLATCWYLLCADLGAQQWGRKKAAALAVTALAKVGAEALPPHTPVLASALLAELPGRLWDGKEALLEALAALAAAAPAALGPAQGSPALPAPSVGCSSGEQGTAAGPGEGAVVDALLAAVARKKSAYRAAALKALESALGGLQGDHYAAVAPALLEAVARNAPSASNLGAAPNAPVRCARCCLSSG